jgi:primosomal replication protein N
LNVLWTSAPDSPVCHRIVSGAPCPYEDEPATPGKTEAPSAIIHRTVWCATGLSGVLAEQQLTRTTVDSVKVNSAATVQHRSQSRKLEGHQTVWCSTRLSGATRRQTLVQFGSIQAVGFLHHRRFG